MFLILKCFLVEGLSLSLLSGQIPLLSKVLLSVSLSIYYLLIYCPLLSQSQSRVTSHHLGHRSNLGPVCFKSGSLQNAAFLWFMDHQYASVLFWLLIFLFILFLPLKYFTYFVLFPVICASLHCFGIFCRTVVTWFAVCVCVCGPELISKLNFLEEDEQVQPLSSSNPFEEADDSEALNPFADPDEEG